MSPKPPCTRVIARVVPLLVLSAAAPTLGQSPGGDASVPWVDTPASLPSGASHGTFVSSAMGREIGVSVYVPPGLEAGTRLPVVYWLPDAGSSEADVRVLAAVASLVSVGRIPPIVVAIPNPGGETGYLDDDGSGVMMETAIVRELVAHVEAQFPVVASSGGRGIAGIGMGGAGAMELALRNLDAFGAIAALGGAFEAAPEIQRRYGVDVEVAAAADPYALSIGAGPRLRRIPLMLRAGSRDPWIAENRRFAAHLGHQNIEIDYLEVPQLAGDLSDYLDTVGPEVFGFLARSLDRERP